MRLAVLYLIYTLTAATTMFKITVSTMPRDVFVLVLVSGYLGAIAWGFGCLVSYPSHGLQLQELEKKWHSVRLYSNTASNVLAWL